MNFTADKQTLDDLNLLGKYKPGSIYGIFNKVHTRGGERLLEEMFRYPLSDPEQINQRSKVFSYLQGKPLLFPFNREEFNLVEDYLGAETAGSRLATLTGIFRKQLLETVVKDEAYGILLQGIRSMVTFVHTCRSFIVRLEEKEEDSHLQEQIRSIKAIVEDRRLAGLPQDASASQSWQKIARLHNLFSKVLQKEMGQLCKTLYYLDVCIAVSKVAAEKGFSYARALPEDAYVFRASDLRHPVLEKAIGNSIALDVHSNVVFLTGANMAGKSTFMKSFGIALYMGHMGFPVAAREMEFSVKEGLFSSINLSDDLTKGYSHFYAEVQRVKSIAEEVSQSRSLVVIFDELFKGTNVKDAYDATLAVSAAFARYRNCFFIISTHIIEVGETLRQQLDNLQFIYLPTIMEGAVPRYTYRMEEGITSDRHGMMIIEQEGIFDIINGSMARR